MFGIRFLYWLQYFFLISILLVFSVSGYARPMNGELSLDSPVPVNVSLRIKEISKVDAKEGTFILYYHLAYGWQGQSVTHNTVEEYTGNEAEDFLKTIWTPGLDFTNKAQKPIILNQSVSVNQKGEVNIDQYGYVKLLANYNFKNFPFDTQNFPILISSLEKNIVFNVPKKAIVFKNTSQTLTWHLRGVTHTLNQVPNVFGQGSVSQIKVSIYMKRDDLYYVTKMYVPLLTFILITCAIFCYPDPEFRFKIPVLLTCLVLISLFSLRAFSEIPPVSYFTRLDNIIGLSRLWLLVGFFYSLTVYLLRISRGEEAPKAFSKKQLIIRCAFPVVYVLFWVFAVLKGFSL